MPLKAKVVVIGGGEFLINLFEQYNNTNYTWDKQENATTKFFFRNK